MTALGETALGTLIAEMRPVLDLRRFAFATVPSWEEAIRIPAHMVFREEEGVTLIAEWAVLEAHGLKPSFPCHKITLSIHSSLEAVGFIATVSRVLTKASIGTNPIAGFYHDHLFIEEEKAEEALRILQDLAAHSGSE